MQVFFQCPNLLKHYLRRLASGGLLPHQARFASLLKEKGFLPVTNFFSPTSLCGVLVFGCVLAPSSFSSRLLLLLLTPHLLTYHLPPHHLLTHHLPTHHLPTHNLLTHTTYSHTYSLLTGRRGSGRRGSGRRGTYGTELALVAILVPGDAARLCLAGVALGDVDLHFAWQGGHLVTSTCTLRGRRGTCGTGLALVARLVPGDAARLCVAGVALGDIHLLFP